MADSSKKLTVCLVAVLSGALLVSAWATAGTQAAPRTLPTLRMDYFADQPTQPAGGLAQTLDPAQIAGSAAAAAVSLVNANLVKVLPNDKVAPDLATWSISRDRLVYTFTIRRGARFSNGRHVTAADVEFSLKRALAPSTKSDLAISDLSLVKGALAYHNGKSKTMSGVRVIDSRRIQIITSKPASYFLAALSTVAADVLDPNVVSGKRSAGPDDYLTTTCRGNQGAGPFKFLCRTGTSDRHSFYSGAAASYTLVPNPYYYGRKPRFRIRLPDVTQGYKRYIGGGLDTTHIPSAYLSSWRGKSNQYLEYAVPFTIYLIPNAQMPPFNNVHCRRALAYSMNRDVITKRILHGTSFSTYAVVPIGMLGYSPGKNNPHFNPARARAELAKCPGRSAPIELKAPPGDPDSLNADTGILNMLRAVGMNATLKSISFDDYGNQYGQPLSKTGTQLLLGQWFEDFPDPHDFCSALLRSGEPSNLGGWHSRAYDRLVDKADVIFNRKERAKLYVQAQRIALDQGAWISLYDVGNQYLIKPYVHGLIGSSVYRYPTPRNDDWANVSISKH